MLTRFIRAIFEGANLDSATDLHSNTGQLHPGFLAPAFETTANSRDISPPKSTPVGAALDVWDANSSEVTSLSGSPLRQDMGDVPMTEDTYETPLDEEGNIHDQAMTLDWGRWDDFDPINVQWSSAPNTPTKGVRELDPPIKELDELPISLEQPEQVQLNVESAERPSLVTSQTQPSDHAVDEAPECRLVSPSSVDLDASVYKEGLDFVMEKGFNMLPNMYRPLQLDAMVAALAGHDIVVRLATGGGKSLAFQVPALYVHNLQLHDGLPLTVVVSPSISLIRDHMLKLHSLRIRAVSLHKDQSEEEQTSNRRSLLQARILYITPERLVNEEHLRVALTERFTRGLLARFVIDEAHCIAEYGGGAHRPDYGKLGCIRVNWPTVPITLLSATFTNAALSSTLVTLRMTRAIDLKGSLNRTNLRYAVRIKFKDDACFEDMLAFILEKHKGQCGIIYAFRIADCESVAANLRQRGISAYHFHSKCSSKEKKSVQSAWMAGTIDIVVATTAFGMGIDKPSVRFVIHVTVPKTLDGYIQEAGRAGRDGEPADCLLYFSTNDTKRPSDDKAAPVSQDVIEYSVDNRTCRRVMLLTHLGEHFLASDCKVPCDNCSPESIDKPRVCVTQQAMHLMELLQEILTSGKNQATFAQLVNAYHGAKRPEDGGTWKEARWYGGGKGQTRRYDQALEIELIREKVITFKWKDNAHGGASYLEFGSRAWNFLNGEFQIYVDAVEK